MSSRTKVRILVSDDEAGLREMLGILFQRAGFEVTLATGVRDAIERIGAHEPFDVIVTDLVMPDGSGMEVLRAARSRDDTTQVVMITAFATTDRAVAAMREGAYDYIQKPFRNDELRATVDKALEKRAITTENRMLREHISGEQKGGGLVGKSQAMTRVTDMVRRVASAAASVLITGESGTGKEMVARALHDWGDRKPLPFVAVNCGALPEALMESELFGHEKGSFTGATSSKEGLFRAAKEGTIFLDEIAELPASLQVKLLRALQERKVRAVGGSEEIEVEARVVAATNRDVEADVASGRVRQDLFYRLNVIRIHIPPLRERPEDIPVLAEHFLRRHGVTRGRRLTLDPSAHRWLSSQPFAGNARELENLMERAATLAADDHISVTDLTPPPLTSDGASPNRPFGGNTIDLDTYLGEVEKKLLLDALDRAQGVRTRAAKLVGMTFRSFRYRLAKYGISDADDNGDEPSTEQPERD